MTNPMHWLQFVGIGLWAVAALAGLVTVLAAVDMIREASRAKEAAIFGLWMREKECADSSFAAFAICFVAACLCLLLGGFGFAAWEFGG